MSKRRRLLIAIGIFLLVLAALAAFYWFVIRQAEETTEPEYDKIKRFYTEEPDWTEDILEDEEYLALNRTVYYSNGAERFILFADDESVHPSAQIFLGYIDAIINGDREKVNSYYTDTFIEEIEGEADKEESKRHPYYRSVTQDFTMQRLYDITLTFVGTPVDEDTGEQYVYYHLEYKISRNNGTFLDILGENYNLQDVSLTQHIKVVERNGEYKIASVGFSIPKELD